MQWFSYSRIHFAEIIWRWWTWIDFSKTMDYSSARVFCKTQPEARYLFSGAHLGAFVLSQTRSLRFLSCHTFRKFSLSKRFGRKASVFCGFQSCILSYRCCLGVTIYKTQSSFCLRSSLFCRPSDFVNHDIGMRWETRLIWQIHFFSNKLFHGNLAWYRIRKRRG